VNVGYYTTIYFNTYEIGALPLPFSEEFYYGKLLFFFLDLSLNPVCMYDGLVDYSQINQNYIASRKISTKSTCYFIKITTDYNK